MLSQKTIAALAEHGDIWCMDLGSLHHYLEEGERKRQPRIPRVNGSVAVIPLQGVITKRGGFWSDGTDRVIRAVDMAMNSKSIGGVVLDIDSPGGSSSGLMEFADRLYAYRQNEKPLLGVANTLAASAALWAGSSVDQFIASPSADVGSLGVWSLHMDFSKAMEDIGIKPTFVYAGKYKVEGNPFEPLSEEAQAEMQRSVDEVYDQFIGAMARNRGVARTRVLSDFGQGRILSADRAKAAGMIDRVSSLEDVINAMGGAQEPTGKRTDASEVERQILAAWNGERVEEVSGTHVEALRAKRQRERRSA